MMAIASAPPVDLSRRPIFLSSPSLTAIPSLSQRRRCFPPATLPRLESEGTKKTKAARKRSLSFRCNAQLLDDIAPATSAAYGTLLLGGGLFAYARSGSKGSILGGLSGAALMAAAYYLMQSPETEKAGEALGFGSAFLFSSVFGIRLVATRKLIPSGFLLALSVGSLVIFLTAYMQEKIITPA